MSFSVNHLKRVMTNAPKTPKTAELHTGTYKLSAVATMCWREASTYKASPGGNRYKPDYNAIAEL